MELNSSPSWSHKHDKSWYFQDTDLVFRVILRVTEYSGYKMTSLLGLKIKCGSHRLFSKTYVILCLWLFKYEMPTLLIYLIYLLFFPGSKTEGHWSLGSTTCKRDKLTSASKFVCIARFSHEILITLLLRKLKQVLEIDKFYYGTKWMMEFYSPTWTECFLFVQASPSLLLSSASESYRIVRTCLSSWMFPWKFKVSQHCEAFILSQRWNNSWPHEKIKWRVVLKWWRGFNC